MDYQERPHGNRCYNAQPGDFHFLKRTVLFSWLFLPLDDSVTFWRGTLILLSGTENSNIHSTIREHVRSNLHAAWLYERIFNFYHFGVFKLLYFYTFGIPALLIVKFRRFIAIGSCERNYPMMVGRGGGIGYLKFFAVQNTSKQNAFICPKTRWVFWKQVANPVLSELMRKYEAFETQEVCFVGILEVLWLAVKSSVLSGMTSYLIGIYTLNVWGRLGVLFRFM